ncbi:MAG: hypothetical protein IPN76_21660 [Saprospiraceae bacterium]|nr:hypothetical protein [Saprospiraceae bacterium]
MEEKLIEELKQSLSKVIFESLDRQKFEWLGPQIGRPFDEEKAEPSFANMVFKVVTRAFNDKWHFELIDKLMSQLPENEALLKIAKSTGLTARGVSNLEGIGKQGKIHGPWSFAEKNSQAGAAGVSH